MALIDFAKKLADHATSDSMQRKMRDKYENGGLSQESYDKYRNAVDNYNSRKPPKDEDY